MLISSVGSSWMGLQAQHHAWLLSLAHVSQNLKRLWQQQKLPGSNPQGLLCCCCLG